MPLASAPGIVGWMRRMPRRSFGCFPACRREVARAKITLPAICPARAGQRNLAVGQLARAWGQTCVPTSCSAKSRKHAPYVETKGPAQSRRTSFGTLLGASVVSDVPSTEISTSRPPAGNDDGPVGAGPSNAEAESKPSPPDKDEIAIRGRSGPSISTHKGAAAMNQPSTRRVGEAQ